jgi:diguanylate cyclase (GGDEF)-like protein
MVCPPESNIASAVLESYLALIAEMAWCIGVTCPDVASPHQEHLLRMRSRLAFAADEQTLAETRGAIENELRTYAERARALVERRADDLRRILKAFSQVTEVLGERNEAGSRQFAEFSARVQGIADVVPWLDIRDALREIIADAGSELDVQRLDSQLAQAHVEEQIRVFQSRLAARNPQHLDLLTGLGNRRAVEEQITRRMESGKAFTLLLFQSASLAGVAAKEGPPAADQVLVQAAARLAGQVRAHDYVGRWGANEFAIVMECPLEIAGPRSQQIARWLSGPYVLRGGAMETQVNATFTVRVVDPSEVAVSAGQEPETSPLPA